MDTKTVSHGGTTNKGKTLEEKKTPEASTFLEEEIEDLTQLLPFQFLEWSPGDRCMQSDSVGRIVNITTKVDVLWENGDTSRGVDSSRLIHTLKQEQHGFWPKQQVKEKTSLQRIGVVKSVDSKQRKAVVKWMRSGVPETEEVVRICELSHEPDNVGELGDLVFRLSTNRTSISSAGSKGKRPWVGLINDFTPEGDIGVVWQDESISYVEPREVMIQAFADDSETYEDDFEANDLA